MKRTSSFVLKIISGLLLTQLVEAQPQVISSFLFSETGHYASVAPGVPPINSFMPAVGDGLFTPFRIREEPLFPMSNEVERLKKKWSSSLFPGLPEKIDLTSKSGPPAVWPEPNRDMRLKSESSESLLPNRARHAPVTADLIWLRHEFNSEHYPSQPEPDLDNDADKMLFLLYMKMEGIVSSTFHGQQYFLWNNGGSLVYLTKEELYQMYLRWLRRIQEVALERILTWIERYEAPVKAAAGNKGDNKRNPKRPPEKKDEKKEESDSKRKKVESDQPGPSSQAGPPPSSQSEQQEGATGEKKKNRTLDFREEADEKKAINSRVEKKGGQKSDLAHFEARVGKFSRVMANALSNWGNVLIDLRNSGMAEPPQTGEELARAIRDRLKYSKESQYLVRMIRYLQVMRLPPDHEHSALLARYQRILIDLLQYIALHRNHWLLSEELIEQWLHFEDLQWLRIFADFPNRQEWAGVQPSGIEIPEALRHAGTAVTAELARYLTAIRGHLPPAEDEEEDEVEPDPNAGIFYHYVPVSDHSYVVSLFFTLALLADDETMRALLLGWMRTIDANHNIETDFFQYVWQDVGGLMLFTIPRNLREALLIVLETPGAFQPDPLLAGFDLMALDTITANALPNFSEDFDPHPTSQPEVQPQPEQDPSEEMEQEQADDS